MVFLAVADLFLFLIAGQLIKLNNTSLSGKFYVNYVLPDSVISFVALVDDLPVVKPKFTKCPVRILKIKSGKDYQRVTGTCFIYFRRSLNDSLLQAGKTLLIKAKFSEIAGPQNPDEFDYKNYLLYKQIYHTVFVDSTSFLSLGINEGLNPIWKAGLDCKRYVLNALKNSSLSTQAYAICSALLTGYDDEIDKSVMSAFSHSGTLHVLSVSGLHTGLIYLALCFIFDLVDRKKKYKLSRFVTVTVVLWLFALISGFSAPVLRAVIMFNLLGIGRLYFRNSSANQLNILLVSAFILLCYNPWFITDVGFLLSYFALAGLICFQPGITRLWQPHNFIINAVWQSASSSVAATISTLPFTLFYFKQFPLWFLVCNMVVIPATFVILLLALLVVLNVGFAAILINYIILFLVEFINLFDSPRYGFLDGINFTSVDALFLSVLTIILSIALHRRTFNYLRLSFIILICWQLSALGFSYTEKNNSLLTVYSINHKTALSIKNKTAAHLWITDSSAYDYHVKPHIISFNNPELYPRSAINFIKTKQETILVLNRPGQFPRIDLSEITTIILCNGFRLTSVDLKTMGKIKRLVLDGSNNPYSIRETEGLCMERGIKCNDLRKEGAFLLPL